MILGHWLRSLAVVDIESVFQSRAEEKEDEQGTILRK